MVFGVRSETLTLSIAGPEAREMPLSVWGPFPVSGSTSLFTQGPEANSLSLWIGKDAHSSGNMPFYLQVPWATGSPGSTLTQGNMPLFVSSTSGAPISTEASLYISSPLTGSGIGTVPLHIFSPPLTPEQYDPPFEIGFEQAFLTVAVSGGIVAQDSQTTLFIRIEENPTSTIPLYMGEAGDLAASIPLSIKSQSPSGVMPVAISGAYFQTSSTSLYIQSPTTKGLTTYTKGYLE